MMECSFTWRARTRIDDTPLDHWCRCLRPTAHDGHHRCTCEPIDFFTFQYAYEHQDDAAPR